MNFTACETCKAENKETKCRDNCMIWGCLKYLKWMGNAERKGDDRDDQN